MGSIQNDIIQAAPLLLEPLDVQIKKAGGRGYNCDVVTKPIPGTFSALYSFKTPEGIKTIKTPNDYQVGLVDADLDYFVMYDADTGEYSLVTKHTISNPPYRTLVVRKIGHTFDDMRAYLKRRWPNRTVWNLTHPNEALK